MLLLVIYENFISSSFWWSILEESGNTKNEQNIGLLGFLLVCDFFGMSA